MAAESKLSQFTYGAYTDQVILARNLASQIKAQSTKINELVHALFPHDASGKGGVLDTGLDPRYSKSIDFNTEIGITPIESGIDGTSIYAFGQNELLGNVPLYATLHPVFFKASEVDPTLTRPSTVYESLLGIIDWVNDELSTLSVSISTGDSCITDCEYTKTYIGEQAFDVTASNAVGSMAYKIETALCYVSQLKEEVLGETFALKPYAGGDCTQTSVCSLNEKVDALLRLHGGEAYVSNQTSTGCNIELEADGDACEPKYVWWLDAAAAEKFYISWIDDTTHQIEPAYTSTHTAVDALYGLGIDADPFSNTGAYVPLWNFETDGGNHKAHNTVARWNWSPNGAHERFQTDFNLLTPTVAWDADFEEIDTDRSVFRMGHSFNVHVVYDWLCPTTPQTNDGGGGVMLPIDCDTHAYGWFEISLFGNLPNDGTTNQYLAKYSGSYSKLNELDHTPYSSTDNAHPVLRPGPNKICLAKNLTLNDFLWNPVFMNQGFTHNDGTSHKVKYATITMVHKASDAFANLWNLGDITAYWGDLRLIGCEVEVFDAGCAIDLGPVLNVLELSLNDGTANATSQFYSSTGTEIGLSLNDGTTTKTGNVPDSYLA